MEYCIWLVAPWRDYGKSNGGDLLYGRQKYVVTDRHPALLPHCKTLIDNQWECDHRLYWLPPTYRFIVFLCSCIVLLRVDTQIMMYQPPLVYHILSDQRWLISGHRSDVIIRCYGDIRLKLVRHILLSFLDFKRWAVSDELRISFGNVGWIWSYECRKCRIFVIACPVLLVNHFRSTMSNLIVLHRKIQNILA